MLPRGMNKGEAAEVKGRVGKERRATFGSGQQPGLKKEARVGKVVSLFELFVSP
jgi:hypothetical protein